MLEPLMKDNDKNGAIDKAIREIGKCSKIYKNRHFMVKMA